MDASSTSPNVANNQQRHRKQQEVFVVHTGTANIASVLAALTRVGAHAQLTHDPDVVRNASHVVLPGVGTLGAAMNALHDHQLVQPLCDRIAADLPTMAICVGMQLMCDGSEESPGAAGLKVVPGFVRRFPNTVRVPQMAWNDVYPSPECRFVKPGAAYFAQSYRLPDDPAGWHVSHAHHGGQYVASLERGNVLLCQFHPELSGAWGLDLISRWLEAAK